MEWVLKVLVVLCLLPLPYFLFAIIKCQLELNKYEKGMKPFRAEMDERAARGSANQIIDKFEKEQLTLKIMKELHIKLERENSVK